MAEDLWGVDEFNQILEGVANARVDEAAQSRSRREWISQQIEAEATLAGYFADVAGTGRPISVSLPGGTELHGTVQAVGADVCALRLTAGVALVALAAVVAIRFPEFGVGPSAAPNRSRGRQLRDVLADAAADRRDVQIITTDGTRTSGQLRAVGVDVLAVRTGAGDASTVLIARTALAACLLLDAR